jgi:hypothetical protein
MRRIASIEADGRAERGSWQRAFGSLGCALVLGGLASGCRVGDGAVPGPIQQPVATVPSAAPTAPAGVAPSDARLRQIRAPRAE